MEVHLGKGCLGRFECGLCDSVLESSEVLETHLNTCEVYECGRYYGRFTMLKHAKEEHLECYHHRCILKWTEITKQK